MEQKLFKKREGNKMAKMKNSRSSKFLAVLLVISILIGTIQPTVAKAVENTNALGTIDTLVSGGTVEGNTVTFSGTELTWSPKDEEIGRNIDGWWVGIQVNAPENMDSEQLKNSKYKYANSDNVKEFWKFKDSADDAENHNIQLWGVLNEEYLINAIANGKTVNYQYEFDWDNDGTYEQPITMSVDPNEITLLKEDVVVYPNPNYATVTPLTGGTFSGDSESLELVIDEATLNWSDVDASVGRHTAGWWVGMKVTAPVGYTAEELQNAYYNRQVTSSTSDTGWSDATKVLFKDAKDSEDTDAVQYVEMWMVITPSLVEKYQALNRNISTSYAFDWDNDGTTEQTITISVVPSEKIVLNKVAPEFEVADVDLTYGTTEHQIVINEIQVGTGKYVYSIEGENNVGASVDENGLIKFTDSDAKVGSITVKVKKEADDTFYELEKTFKVNVSYHVSETNPTVVGEKAEGSDWYSSEVTIQAPDGYKISASDNKLSTSDWADSVSINTDGVIDSKDIYLKSVNDGFITDAIEIKDIKVDKSAPTVTLQIKAVETDSEAKKTIWEKIVEIVTFRIFTNKEEKMIINATDNLSGIKTIQGYELHVKAGETEAEIKEKLLNVAKDDWKELYTAAEGQTNAKDVEGPVLKNNKNIIYCVKVVDYAGNEHYVTSDGIIFDITMSVGVLDDGTKMLFPTQDDQTKRLVPNTSKPLYGKEEVGEDGVITFDVNITEKTINEVLQSGIKSVSYEINAWDRKEQRDADIMNKTTEGVKATKTDVLYSWTEGTDLNTEYKGTITVDSEKFNYNYVDITVTVVDNAGNITAETYEFAIDITAPTVAIKYTNNQFVGFEGKDGRGYFDAERTLYVTYTERTENWNAKEAEKVLTKNGEKPYTVEWQPSVQGAMSDGDTHIAKIEFVDGIHYNVEKPAYTDVAGNSVAVDAEGNLIVEKAEETEYPYVFSIDKLDGEESEDDKWNNNDSAAEIKFEVVDRTWIEEFLHTISFGKLFTNKEEKVVVTVEDDFAGIREIKYLAKYFTEGKQDENIELEDVLAYTGWEIITFEEDKDLSEILEREITLPKDEPNKNVVAFVIVTDYAGHQRVFCTDGLNMDVTTPKPALDSGKLVYPETEAGAKVPASGRPLYNTEEVVFNIAVTEETIKTVITEATEETQEVAELVLQSGIKSVSYEINAWDRKEQRDADIMNKTTEGVKATKTDVLYSWTEGTDLNTEYKGTITVDSEKFNYNYVDITVTVVDNAGNITTETYEFAIDIKAPTVAIEYNMNVPVDEANDLGYFNCQRIATITYTERSENWNSDKAAKKLVAALDINGKPIEDDDNPYTINWLEETVEEKATHLSDEDTHIAIVSFNPTNILETEYTIEPVTGADARYTLDLSYTDAAGNSIAKDENDELVVEVAEGTVYAFNFVIDTVSPEVVDIDFKEVKETFVDTLLNNLAFNYFGANAEVTVTLRDETAGINEFDYEGLLDADISDKNKAVILTAVQNADIKQQTETDMSEFVVKFQIPKEALTELNSFRGTVRVNAWDYCDNTVQKHDETRLVVDKIAPTCQVTFDQPVNEVEGISYYDKAFTATIVIDEANFYAEDVVINVNGSRVVPTDWTQTPGTDIWTSHVSFTAENDYVLTVNYTDRSGNVMTAYESNQRTLDTTEPVISVSNIKHESANNQETIGFTLTITDKNMALANVKPQATAVIREGDSSANYTYKTVDIDLGTPAVTTNASGETVYTYTVTNLEIDGYYSLVCSVVDHANHSVSNIGSVGTNDRGVAVETVSFSVNRGGSVFWIETIHNDKYSDTTFNNKLNGAYANDEVTVKLHEVNVDRVDELEADDKRTVLTLNDGNESKAIELVENSNGNGNYDRNVRIGEGGWYETIYTLGNEQFAKDGTYSLNIITYDKAENSNVNTKNEEGTIKFVVDRTNPVVTTNVKSGQIIDADKYTVEFTVAEVNLDESTIVVKVEGKEQKYQKVSGNIFEFEVEDLLNDEFTIEVKDLAGNSAEEYKIDDLTVSAKWYVRWFANKPLFYGSIGGTLALAGIIIFFVVWKKRKKDEEQA